MKALGYNVCPMGGCICPSLVTQGPPNTPSCQLLGLHGDQALLSLGIALEEWGSQTTPHQITTPPFRSSHPSAQAVKINIARPPLRATRAWLAPKLHPQNAGAEGPDLGEVRRAGGRAYE